MASPSQAASGPRLESKFMPPGVARASYLSSTALHTDPGAQVCVSQLALSSSGRWEQEMFDCFLHLESICTPAFLLFTHTPLSSLVQDAAVTTYQGVSMEAAFSAPLFPPQ